MIHWIWIFNSIPLLHYLEIFIISESIYSIRVVNLCIQRKNRWNIIWPPYLFFHYQLFFQTVFISTSYQIWIKVYFGIASIWIKFEIWFLLFYHINFDSTDSYIFFIYRGTYISIWHIMLTIRCILSVFSFISHYFSCIL